MSNRVNDDLRLRNLVENEIGVRRCLKTANGWIFGADADIGMARKQADDVLDTPLNAFCALRQMRADIIEY